MVFWSINPLLEAGFYPGLRTQYCIDTDDKRGSKTAQRDKLAAALLFAQGAITIAWWPWIRASEEVQTLFFAPGTAEVVLSKFAAPDILVFACGSIVASILAAATDYGRLAAWFVVGAAAYAGVGAFAVNWPLFSVPLADALMAATLLVSAYCAVRLGRARG